MPPDLAAVNCAVKVRGSGKTVRSRHDKLPLKKNPDERQDFLFDNGIQLLTPQSFDHPDEDYGPEQRHQQTIYIESTHAAFTDRTHDPAADYRANHADHDVHEYPLLCVGLHDERRDPAD